MAKEKLIEIKIVGTDNTPVKNCLEDCSIVCDSVNKNKTIKNISKDILINQKKKEYKLKKMESIEKERKTLRDYIAQKLKEDGKEFSEKDIDKELKGNAKNYLHNDELENAYETINSYDKIKVFGKHPILYILEKFSDNLEWEENDKFIVGHREDDDDSIFDIKKCTLYSKYKGDTYFGNIVGTISKSYTNEEFINLFGKEGLESIVKGSTYVKITVEIRTRFDSSKDRPFFLLSMLTQGKINFNEKSVPKNEDSIFDCLLLLRLKKHLMEAYQKGIYRAYQNFSENGTKIKGSINFASHIKLNMGMKNGCISYSYREKSADNYLNHLILLAYEHLKKLYPDLVSDNIDNDYEVKSVLDLLRTETQFPKHSKELLMRKCENPISHPYYTEYEELRRTCIRILRNEGFSLFGGKGEDVQGVLYYVPDLWEEYLESKMTDMHFESQKEVRIFDNEDEKYRFRSRPDYVFYYYDEDRNKQPYLILDAKFIPRWFYLAHCEGKVKSLILDYNKCIRDMNSLGVLSTGTIFPFGDGDDKCGDIKSDEENIETNKQENIESEETDENKRKNFEKIRSHRVSKYNSVTTFYTVPIHVPSTQDNSYYKWKKDFDSEINEQIRDLNKYLEFEKNKFKLINDERMLIEEKISNFTYNYIWSESQEQL